MRKLVRAELLGGPRDGAEMMVESDPVLGLPPVIRFLVTAISEPAEPPKVGKVWADLEDEPIVRRVVYKRGDDRNGVALYHHVATMVER